MRSQNERVLDYIREHGQISALDAFNMREDGIRRPITALHSRIADLRRDGHRIRKAYVRKNGGYYAYRLEADE